MTPGDRVAFGNMLSRVHIFHKPIKTVTLQRFFEMETNWQIARGNASSTGSCTVVKVWKFKNWIEKFQTFEIVHPCVDKAVVVLDEDIVGALWAKIVRVIIAENVSDLSIFEHELKTENLLLNRARFPSLRHIATLEMKIQCSHHPKCPFDRRIRPIHETSFLLKIKIETF